MSKWEDFKYELWHVWYYHLIDPVRLLYQGIRNLIIWFPIIWKDRQWNDVFIYILLEKKFKLMSNMQRKYGNSTKHNEIADQLQWASALCSRILNESYLQETCDKYHYDEKFPNDILTFSDEPNERGNYAVIWSDNKEQQELFSKCSKESDELEAKDKEELWSLIKNHIDEWWD